MDVYHVILNIKINIIHNGRYYTVNIVSLYLNNAALHSLTKRVKLYYTVQEMIMYFLQCRPFTVTFETILLVERSFLTWLKKP